MPAEPRGTGQAEDYRRAGFGAELGPGERPALLVVDLVRAYLDPDCPLYAGVEPIVGRTARLAAEARRLGHPVVFTYVSFRTAADGGQFFRKVPSLRFFLEGSPFAAPPPELAPEPGDLTVTKQYPSAFFGTSLASTLVALRVDSVVVTGVSTSGCVRASALDALCHGLRPTVVTDAVGDRAPAPHEAALFDLGAKYADLADTAAVLDAWKARA
ncbi:N-carbamoylsarcosine amidohydrolase [Actinomadura luteofluorescens]|uniref:isochorismatase family protein n=1 Tax=Actinomadura luteofluorescens TaxID=46163 RepID=UPI002164E371|nr:isochorismatase family protein [Actinomadura glauciflava]MCR3740775.1 maleamate amidohydrolase [Actinomadura glauciflava]